jgi:hypothetical protein
LPIFVVNFVENKMKSAACYTLAAGLLLLTGCACTRIKQLSGSEFQKQANQCNLAGSFSWTTYVGVSHQNAYLEYGHPAFVGKGTRITVYWTPLSELPGNLVAQLKAGTPPWTNWMTAPTQTNAPHIQTTPLEK